MSGAHVDPATAAAAAIICMTRRRRGSYKIKQKKKSKSRSELQRGRQPFKTALFRALEPGVCTENFILIDLLKDSPIRS
jgi:hypothetical protein